MPINKNALLRYHTLDKCFSNRTKRFFMDDLIEACTSAIEQNNGEKIREGSLSSRQIFQDIKFMESPAGYEIELVRLKEDRRVYYRYKDPTFSIKNKAINESEALQLKETLLMLNRFKGIQELGWIEEMAVRIEAEFGLKKKNMNNASIVEFQQNPYLKGLSHFQELFDSINNEIVLDIKYQGYKQEAPVVMRIHPYFMKQYNNRWFLFGLNEGYGKLSNLAIDRIIELKQCTSIGFKPNTIVDFNTYFDDVVGVTVNEDTPVEKIVLDIDAKRWPYIASKPMHGSQKVIGKSEDKVTVSLEVKVNHELETLILSYGADVRVLEPWPLVDNLRNKITAMSKNYSSYEE